MDLQGERIRLVPISDKDTEDIVKWRNRDFVREGFIYRERFTAEGHGDWLEGMVKAGKAEQFMISLNGSGRKIGSSYVRDIDHANRKGEFGIFIGEPDMVGKGIGQETARLVMGYAFEHLEIHKLFLRVLAENERAYRSYIKAGFLQEGYFKDDVWIDGRPYDVIFMAQYKDLWQRCQGRGL